MSVTDCHACFGTNASLREEKFFAVTTLHCDTCGLIVDTKDGTGMVGRLNRSHKSGHSAAPSPRGADEAIALMHVIQGESEVEAAIRPQLDLAEGTACQFHHSAAEALAEFTRSVREGRSIRLLLFNPEVTEDSGSAFLYGIRAVEMAMEASSTPVLVLGESISAEMERAIRECKNAKFVGIGRAKDPLVLADRYLKVVGKLTKA